MTDAPAPDEVLRRLELTITHKLDGLLQGDYRGLVPGHGSDLGETRLYQPGDDTRRIDWNVTARMQTPYVRDTIADRELETWVLVDQSASLDFGTANCEKRDLVLNALAAIGFLTSRNGNRLGAVLLRPGQSPVTVPARTGRVHLRAVLHRVLTAPRLEGAGPTDLATAIDRFGATIQRRGLAVVVSDWLDPTPWQLPMRRLGVRHEVLAIEVVDPRELALADVGVLELVDPETGFLYEVQTSDARLRERYAAAAAAQREAIARDLRASGAGHLTLRTDTDWMLDLVRYVVSRRQNRRSAAPSIIVS
jgi:uncharacterized protein (DUF58 family)